MRSLRCLGLGLLVLTLLVGPLPVAAAEPPPPSVQTPAPPAGPPTPPPGQPSSPATPSPTPTSAESRPAAADSVQVAGAVAAGRVWGWGHNYYGQLNYLRPHPQPLPSDIDYGSVRTVVGGDFFSTALVNNGTVKNWGDNTWGQIGYTDNWLQLLICSINNLFCPSNVDGLSSITAISSGRTHTLALKSDGTVWSWGNANYGKLGRSGDETCTGAACDRNAALVPNLSGIVAVAAGNEHSLALDNQGRVWSWGYNGNNQLGRTVCSDLIIRTSEPAAAPIIISPCLGGFELTSTNRPGLVSSLTGVTAISTMYDHNLAVRNDGSVWAWGTNGAGELGNNASGASVRVPVRVQQSDGTNIANVTAVAAGYQFSLARKSDGTVWSWGRNDYGQLGDGTKFTCCPGRLRAVQATNLTNVSAIATGAWHGLALRSDGTVRAWGWNGTGQLGNNTLTDSVTPVTAVGVANAVKVAAGWGHSFALVKATPTASLVSSASPARFGQAVTLTATFGADAGGNPMPTGTVTFKEGAATLGSSVLNGSGVATLSNLKLPIGSHTITAEYPGDPGYVARTASVTYSVVKSDTSVAVTTSENPIGPGSTYTLTATISPVAPGGGTPTSGAVTFSYLKNGVNAIGVAQVGANGKAVLPGPALPVNDTYNIIAEYAGNDNYVGSTSPANTLFLQVSSVATVITANAGGPYTVAEGGQVLLTGGGASGGNPNVTLYFEWHADSENGPIIGLSKNVTFNATGLSGPASQFVVLKVCNLAKTICSTDAESITITNVAPTATLYAPPNVNRGSAFVLSLGQPADPGAGDLAKLEYSFDCGDGGGFGAYSAKPTTTCNVLPNSSTGNRTARGRLRNTDSPAQVNTYQAVVLVRPWTVRFRDSFEAGLSTNVWDSQSTRFPGTTPSWTTRKCFQDTLSANPKAGKDCAEPYPTNYSTWLITQQKVDLTGGTDAALTFRLAWNLGSADLLRIYVHSDFDQITSGEVFATPTLSSWSPQSGAEGSWRSFEVNLSQWKGQFVFVGFYFSSANDGSQAEGVFLDDVELAVQETPAAAYGIGASTWYFAEGWTGPGYQEYLTIQNPNDRPAEVRITYYLTGADPVTRTKTVPANSRETVIVHQEQEGVGTNGGQGWPVSAKVESTNGTGIVVERPMYFTHTLSTGGSVTGGHNVMGVQAPRQRWYFAEGWTGVGFDEFLTLMNPHGVPALITITYFRGGADTVKKTLTLPPRSRDTVVVHDDARGVGRNNGQGWAVSALVESDLVEGIVAERPMYFVYNAGGLNVNGGHNVMGAAEPRTTWYFPTGDTRAGWHTYLTLVNPTNQDAQVKLTYYVVNGGTVPVTYTVPANRRETVAVHEAAKGVGVGKQLGIAVASTNGVPLIVERPMYFQYNATVNGGHDVMGAPGPAGTWLFAEGYTANGFDEELVILNPNATDAQVTITYQLGPGKSRAPVPVTVPANSRTTTLLIHDTTFGVGRGANGNGEAVSARVATTHPGGIVVERPMYFRLGAIDGGHTVMGFIP